jgi:hypothetical protein
MPVGRDVRHTRVRTDTYRQVLKEVPIYANEMYGRPYGIGADPTPGVEFNSPYQSFDPVTVQGICADLKLPVDRVMGTPVKFSFVYYIPTGPGGGTVVWRLDYLMRRVGQFINVVPTTRDVRSVAPSIYVIAKSPYITIPGWEVDWFHQVDQSVEFQLGIIRWADHAADNEPSAARLLKLVMEYTAYT